MEEGDIGHHRLLIWLCDTYVCEVGRRGYIRAEIKNSGIGIGREREGEQREVWKGWWGGGGGGRRRGGGWKRWRERYRGRYSSLLGRRRSCRLEEKMKDRT